MSGKNRLQSKYDDDDDDDDDYDVDDVCVAGEAKERSFIYPIFLHHVLAIGRGRLVGQPIVRRL